MNRTIFVFCEGKTEAAYIDLLRRCFRVPVEIIARVSDSNISQPYIERCKRERFTTDQDKTFLMFDLDVAGMRERLSRIKDVTLLLSNPCVEYWFLLHYNDVCRELSSSECLNLLKKIVPDYTKGSFSSEMKEVLIKDIASATLRAKNKVAFENPSSTIHLFTDEIISLAKG